MASACQPSTDSELFDLLCRYSDGVLIFSLSYCPFCKRAKNQLGLACQKTSPPTPIHIVELDLPGNEQWRNPLKRLFDFERFPQIFAGGVHVGDSEATNKLFLASKLTSTVKLLSSSPPARQ